MRTTFSQGVPLDVFTVPYSRARSTRTHRPAWRTTCKPGAGTRSKVGPSSVCSVVTLACLNDPIGFVRFSQWSTHGYAASRLVTSSVVVARRRIVDSASRVVLRKADSPRLKAAKPAPPATTAAAGWSRSGSGRRSVSGDGAGGSAEAEGSCCCIVMA